MESARPPVTLLQHCAINVTHPAALVINVPHCVTYLQHVSVSLYLFFADTI